MKKTVAVVGGESLLARELREQLAEQAPEMEVLPAGGDTDETILTQRDGEPVVIQSLDETNLLVADLVMLAGTEESSLRSLSLIRGSGKQTPLIDLTYALEAEPGAVISVPLAGETGRLGSEGGVYLVAHPAARMLTLFLHQLHSRYKVKRAVANILAPASERDREGIAELQRQTSQLLSFQPLEREVFDAQLSFNILPRYGSEAPTSLMATEDRIARQLEAAAAQSGAFPMPSLRLVQAPVFHGYSISVWAEFWRQAEPAALLRSLVADRIQVRSSDEEPATNVGAAGQAGITVERVETDRRNSRGAWFWIVADNHRMMVDDAICLARLLAPGEGRA